MREFESYFPRFDSGTGARLAPFSRVCTLLVESYGDYTHAWKRARVFCLKKKKKSCSWVNMLWNVNSLHDNSPVSSFWLSSAGRTLGQLNGGR